MSFRTTLAGAAVAAAFVASSTNAQVISRFELSDHPDGNQNPPPYGLRLDGLFGGGVTTFSFDPFNVILTVTDSTGIGGGITIDINGRVFGGEVDGNGGWSDPQTYRIDFSYTTNVVAQDGGWKVAGVDNTGNTGTLSLAPTRANSTDLFTITDNDNNAFLFLPDGHRLSGDNSTWGRPRLAHREHQRQQHRRHPGLAVPRHAHHDPDPGLSTADHRRHRSRLGRPPPLRQPQTQFTHDPARALRSTRLSDWAGSLPARTATSHTSTGSTACVVRDLMLAAPRRADAHRLGHHDYAAVPATDAR
ncbi:MAG: hypothetical protein AAF747_10260 [Planctomycetota bacterium]